MLLQRHGGSLGGVSEGSPGSWLEAAHHGVPRGHWVVGSAPGRGVQGGVKTWKTQIWNVLGSFQAIPDGPKLFQTLPIASEHALRRSQTATSNFLAREVGIGSIEQLNCTELSSFNKLTQLLALHKGLQQLTGLQCTG